MSKGTHSLEALKDQDIPGMKDSFNLIFKIKKYIQKRATNVEKKKNNLKASKYR